MIKVTICTKCILPGTFPGIKFDDQGICNHCQRAEKSLSGGQENKLQYQERLNRLVNDLKGNAPVYDVIMAYSGGKDSSYSIKLLKERFDLRIVAFTFDNHFVSPVALENIKKVTDALDIDHIFFQPPWPLAKKMFSLTAKKDIFPAPTLLRASSICTACIGIVKSVVLRTALEMSIPLVAFGWSPGQAPIQSSLLNTNPALIKQNQLAFSKAFPLEIKHDIDQYLIPKVYYEIYKDRFPHNIHPLAFFDYDEDRINNELESLGWEPPGDTDTNSSNCLLNAFANHCHLRRHGFHPYVWEIANIVRQGLANRDEGIQKIYTEQNRNRVEFAKKRLEA